MTTVWVKPRLQANRLYATCAPFLSRFLTAGNKLDILHFQLFEFRFKFIDDNQNVWLEAKSSGRLRVRTENEPKCGIHIFVALSSHSIPSTMSMSIKYLHSAKSRRSNLMHGVWVTRCDRQKRKIKINAGLKSDKTVR